MANPNRTSDSIIEVSSTSNKSRLFTSTPDLEVPDSCVVVIPDGMEKPILNDDKVTIKKESDKQGSEKVILYDSKTATEVIETLGKFNNKYRVVCVVGSQEEVADFFRAGATGVVLSNNPNGSDSDEVTLALLAANSEDVSRVLNMKSLPNAESVNPNLKHNCICISPDQLEAADALAEGSKVEDLYKRVDCLTNRRTGLAVNSRLMRLFGTDGSDEYIAVLTALSILKPKKGTLDDLAKLSNRETEVLKGKAAGKTNKGIAVETGMSLKTVENATRAIREKLNLTIKQAILLLVSAGSGVELPAFIDRYYREFSHIK